MEYIEPLIELKVEQNEQQNEQDNEIYDEYHQDIQYLEQLFAPTPWGCCGKNMWRYYVCGGLISCFDVRHLGMHIFFIFLITLIISLLVSLPSVINGNITVSTYLVPLIVGFFLVIWTWWQLPIKIKLRMVSAELFSSNIKILKIKTMQSISLERKIQTLMELVNKGRETNKTINNNINALRIKFMDLKQLQNIMDENSKIGMLLYHKLKKLETDWKDIIIAIEMNMIESIYNRMEIKNGDKGLDENEFREFVMKLPDKYRKRFRFELEAFAENLGSDEIFDKDELFVFLRYAAQEQAIKL